MNSSYPLQAIMDRRGRDTVRRSSGPGAPLFPGGFAGYCRRPQELRIEVDEAGLMILPLEPIEGAGAYLPDLDERWNTPAARDVVLDVARRCAEAPEMLGVGPHLLVIASRPMVNSVRVIVFIQALYSTLGSGDDTYRAAMSTA